MAHLIRSILDIFYPLFRKFFDKQTYYYAACGGGNLVLSWLLFFVFYQYLFAKRIFQFDLGELHYIVSAYTLSSMLCFVLAFLLGFLLNKFVVFTESQLGSVSQLIRYSMSAVLTWIGNYLLLKTFIEGFGFFPSIANILSSAAMVVVAYLIQRNFTFK
ncbi:MAG: GtrA family protein [Flavobacteriales bacterium]